MNDIVFQKGQGGLGRPLPGQDYYSGLIFYSATLPSGFTSINNIAKILSVSQAESLGITSTYSDETKATATYTVTAIGVTNNTLTVKVLEPGGKLITLGLYTQASTDTTVTLVAAGIAAAINANTLTTGYTATSSLGVVTITARAGLGIFLNTGTPLSVVIVGSITGTIVQFSGGVASKLAVWHYHISEFFRIQPQGVLYVGFFPVPGTYTFTEMATMQTFANGSIRQMGVYKDGAAFATADITALQTEEVTLENVHMPFSILYAADLSGTSDISTLPSLGTLTANKVSSVIGQDGAALGFALYSAYGHSITCLGAQLGAIALAKVSEDIAWLKKFNLTDGTELNVLAFANGQQYSSFSATGLAALLNNLNNSRYIFLRTIVGLTGTFFNDSHTAIVASSDYAYIENNRTIDKAIRGIYSGLIPDLNGPLVLNSDGTLSDNTIAALISDAELNVIQMVRDGDLSANPVITIDPTQNVNSTNLLIVAVSLLPVGVDREIQVNIGFVTS